MTSTLRPSSWSEGRVNDSEKLDFESNIIKVMYILLSFNNSIQVIEFLFISKSLAFLVYFWAPAVGPESVSSA